MCQIERVPLVSIWSLRQAQTMPLFTGVITFPKFVELHPYCVEHKCCLERGRVGNEFDEIDAWVCPRWPDAPERDWAGEVTALDIRLPQIDDIAHSTPQPVSGQRCRELRRRPSRESRSVVQSESVERAIGSP